MNSDPLHPEVAEAFANETFDPSRRKFLTRAGAAVMATLAAKTFAATRRDWTGVYPTRYPDPDIVALDPEFNQYKLGNTPIQRIFHSPNMLWAEGPAWSGVDRYLLWSDIPNDLQLRWLDESGTVSTFRKPSGNSNGNTFDYQGRQISCQHGHRQVVRYEHSGKVTVLAKDFNGTPFNAPNDVVAHPADDSIWFTDPGYGSMWNYEGNKGPLHLKEAIYRIDAQTGKITKVADEIVKPNGLCFSPDYKKLYVSDTGAKHPKPIRVWDVVGTSKLKNPRDFTSMELKYPAPNNPKKTLTGHGGADGIRADQDGNIWASAGWVGDGYDGVHVFNPEGKRIGQIYLPEICSNVCFGGKKRNRLFMTASTSVYAVYTDAIGAHIT